MRAPDPLGGAVCSEFLSGQDRLFGAPLGYGLLELCSHLSEPATWLASLEHELIVARAMVARARDERARPAGALGDRAPFIASILRHGRLERRVSLSGRHPPVTQRILGSSLTRIDDRRARDRSVSAFGYSKGSSTM